jgi:hypothetical protein
MDVYGGNPMMRAGLNGQCKAPGGGGLPAHAQARDRTARYPPLAIRARYRVVILEADRLSVWRERTDSVEHPHRGGASVGKPEVGRGHTAEVRGGVTQILQDHLRLERGWHAYSNSGRPAGRLMGAWVSGGLIDRAVIPVCVDPHRVLPAHQRSAHHM